MAAIADIVAKRFHEFVVKGIGREVFDSIVEGMQNAIEAGIDGMVDAR